MRRVTRLVLVEDYFYEEISIDDDIYDDYPGYYAKLCERKREPDTWGDTVYDNEMYELMHKMAEEHYCL